MNAPVIGGVEAIGHPPVEGDTLSSDGWLVSARRVPSPNHDARPPETVISLLVIHAISLPPNQFGGDAIERFFTNTLPAAEHPFFATIDGMHVSAHFLIRRNGECVQFVSCFQRAWHAGVSCWQGRNRCNDFSIGIELEGCDEQPFEEAQYASLNALIEILTHAFPITAIVGHSEIAPGRKTDPGPFFMWQRIVGAGAALI